MKKLFLLLLSIAFSSTSLLAQTTETHIVADNGARMFSCSDTLITLVDIYSKTGIRDLNDSNDDVSMYKMFRLNGSVITEEELTSVRYSEGSVFVKKMNATAFHNGGIQVFLYVTTPPTSLFSVDTLKFTVEKGATKKYTGDFFDTFTLFNSANDLTDLSERFFFTDESAGTGTELPINQVPDWSNKGAGKYKIKVQVAVCNPLDYYYDSIYVVITETPCLKIEIKNMPSVCREDLLDITPYVYLDDHEVTTSELALMTFTNKSILTNQTGYAFDPTAMDMSDMVDKTTRFPQIQIAYQPNVDLGICANYNYMPTLKVPTKLITTDIVLTKNNSGDAANYTFNGDYYGINNIFAKDIFKKLYVDNFNVHNGTILDFYSDATLENTVTDNNLTPGNYYIIATNPDCTSDSTQFNVTIKNRDFDIVFESAPAIGKGYYTFTAPSYPGATYAWIVWGGSIVSGSKTNQATVYYSEASQPSVTVKCIITLSTARTTADAGMLNSSVYITSDEDGNKKEIESDVTTGIITSSEKNSLIAYPNPAAETFALSGSGMYDVKIYNTLGQLVFASTSYEANTTIQLQNKGMHLVYVTQKGISQLIKVVLE